jgi:phosphoribosylaminoimidazole carboxylase (NCAIR synthetase)
MSILILNRRQIIERLPAWLGSVEAQLLLVTAQNVVTPEAHAAMDSFEEVVIVEDYDGPGVEQIVIDLATRHKVSRVVSSAEIDVIRSAQLRERLGLPGQDVTSAIAYRDKFVMKTRLAEVGIPVAPMALVNAPSVLYHFAAVHGFPLVMKPRCGGGSVGIAILRDEADVRTAANRNWTEPMIVEAWVGGRFLTVDGMMAKGQILQIWPSFTTANLEIVSNSSLLQSCMLTPSDPLIGSVTELVARTIDTLPPVDMPTAFHAEVFAAPSGALTLCEIACRPGGCGHVPVYELAFGVNLFAQTLLGQAGLTAPIPELRHIHNAAAGFVWFPPEPKHLARLPRTCPVPGVVRYETVAAEGSDYAAPRSVADHVARAFLLGAPETDLAPILADVAEWWRKAALWT